MVGVDGDAMLTFKDDMFNNSPLMYDLPLTGSQSLGFDLHNIQSEDLLFGTEDTQPLDVLIQQDDDNKEKHVLQLHEVLPNLDEHDKGKTGFQVIFQSSNKQNWYRAPNSKKIYTKTNDILNAQVQYISSLLPGSFKLRMMMVHDKELSEPVVRCENHSSKDPAKEKNIKHSILRCENPKAVYLGTVEGKNISDRLSILLPLCHTDPNKDYMVNQTVALKFVCQNSCVSRRDTSIIFCLENNKCEVLSKQVVPVKICSCPKRDMKKETEPPRKRTNNALDECPKGKKIMKLESEIKLETGNENEDEEALETNDVLVTTNGVKLSLELPNIEAARHVVRCAFNAVAGQALTNPDNKDLLKHLKLLKKLLGKSEKLKE